jgi:hypothetical protein
VEDSVILGTSAAAGRSLTEKNIEKCLGIALVGLSGACLFLSGTLFAQIHEQNAPQPQMTLRGVFPLELQ